MQTANAKGAPGTHEFRMSSDCEGPRRLRSHGTSQELVDGNFDRFGYTFDLST